MIEQEEGEFESCGSTDESPGTMKSKASRGHRSHSSTRKYTDNSSSDDEFLVPAFPLDDLDESVTVDKELALTSPQEFLKFVRHEASMYPDVTCADFKLKEETHIISVNENDPYGSRSDDEVLNVAIFKELVAEYQCLKKIASELKTLPPMEPKPTSAIFNSSPSLSWIALRSRAEIDVLLNLLSSQCTKKRWNSKLSSWILALLISLEQPLHPDVCFSIRTIAKSHKKLKKECGAGDYVFTDEDDRCFDMCQDVVTHVFGQWDLLE